MKKRQAIMVCSAALVILLGSGLWYWLTRPPQMGADEEVFRAVDALYTAVTARNEKLLRDCEERLKGLRESGKLPTSAGEHLDRIIAMARSGQWQPAAERLYRFMYAQRREGARH